MPFNFHAKAAFLTYPQCNASKQLLYDHLLKLNHPIEKLLVAQETHEDGNPHFHCLIIFKSKPHIRNERYFDYEGFHPNIQGCRSVRKTIEYITKTDKNPISNFEWITTNTKEAAVKFIFEQVELGTHPDEILVECIRAFPNLLTNATSIGHFISRAAKGVTMQLPIYELDSFSLSNTDRDRIKNWRESVSTMDRGVRSNTRSMWFVGPSRLGKTCLARSIGPHWYIGHTWNLTKICDEQGVYGVLDDIEEEWIIKNMKALLGCQKDVSLHDKFYRKKEFKLGYPVIVCTNELPVVTNKQAEWLRVNVDFFCIKNSILPNNPCIDFEIINI